MQGRLTGKLICAAAMVVMATGLGACSVVPNWMNPVSWFSDDAPPPPDLANLPSKPGAKEDHELAHSLKADREHAQYSADALRGGTEPVAAPPPKEDGNGEGVIQTVEATEKADTEKQQAREAQEAAEAAAAVPKTDRSVSSAPKGKPALAGTLPASTFNAAPAATEAKSAPAAKPEQKAEPAKKADDKADKADEKKTSDDMSRADSPVRVARAEISARDSVPYRSLEEHVNANPMVQATEVADKEVVADTKTAQTAPQVSSDGFQKSSAPPLDPSVAQFVPSAVLQQYNSTASAAQQVDLVGTQASGAAGAMNVLARKTVVYFPGDITYLNGRGAAQVRRIAKAYLAAGKPGSLYVIGHSASRTANMPLKAHLALIYKKSQLRAAAVAKALARAGVPAKDIIEQAVGDSQPVYYESMPKGEEGNRRVEIFLQR